MNILDIEVFVEVAQTGSITQAAKNRNVSQPAISRSIANFEAELDTRLFDRIGRNLYLNSFGASILPYALKILNCQRNLQTNLADLGAPRHYPVTVGIASESAEWHKLFVHWFLATYPGINIRILRLEPERLLQMLQSNKCDFGISTSDFMANNVNCTKFRTESIGILMSVNHRLARQESVSIYDLKHEPFLLTSRNSDIRRFTTDLCARAGFTPNIMLEVDLPGTVEELRCIVDGVSFISPDGFQHLLKSGDAGYNRPWMNLLTYRPLQEDFCVRHCFLCIPTEHYISSVCRQLINHIKSCYTLLDEKQSVSPDNTPTLGFDPV